MNPRYIIVSPTRNEAGYIRQTIDSVVGQTVLPACWIIVDDGSSDDTGRIIDAAAATHPWIRAVHRNNRGVRQAGTGVMEAFYDGYNLARDTSWDFVVKLDGDLSFPPDYFEKCLAEFVRDEKLGIGGGTCCRQVNGTLTPEFTGEPPFHVRGPCKIYRRACFEAMGGLVVAVGWDTADLIKANMLGWSTRTFPHVRLVHHRPTGGAYGTWSNSVKNGLANYLVGYHPLFMLMKCLKRMFRSPNLGVLGLWCGFLKGYVLRLPRAADRKMIRYLRDQQMSALACRKSLWRP